MAKMCGNSQVNYFQFLKKNRKILEKLRAENQFK